MISVVGDSSTFGTVNSNHAGDTIHVRINLGSKVNPNPNVIRYCASQMCNDNTLMDTLLEETHFFNFITYSCIEAKWSPHRI